MTIVINQLSSSSEVTENLLFVLLTIALSWIVKHHDTLVNSSGSWSFHGLLEKFLLVRFFLWKYFEEVEVCRRVQNTLNFHHKPKLKNFCQNFTVFYSKPEIIARAATKFIGTFSSPLLAASITKRPQINDLRESVAPFQSFTIT